MMLLKIVIFSFMEVIVCQGFSYEVRNSSLPVEVVCEEIPLWKQKQFLLLGNVSVGHEIITHCEVSFDEFIYSNNSYKLCNNLKISVENIKIMTETEFNDICWFFNETYNIAKEWQILAEKQQKWLALNDTELKYSKKAMKNSFDDFAFYLKMISDKIYYIKESAISRNLSKVYNNSFLVNISNSKNAMWLENHATRQKAIRSSKVTLYYIRAPLSLVILIFGMFGNSMVIFLFLKHKPLRTSPNTLLLNLVVVDSLNLLVNLLFGYVVHLISFETSLSISVITCQLLIYFEQLCTGLCIWSLVAMSILRYKAVRPKFSKKKYQLTRKQKILIYVTIVWIVSLVLAIPTAYAMGTIKGSCKIVGDRTFFVHWNLLLYSIVPVLIVAVFYTLTARELAKSAKNIPGEQLGQQFIKKARSRGAKVVVTLTIVFAFCYPPLYIHYFLDYWKIIKMKEGGFRVEYIFFFLIYVNSAVNPVALYASSVTFRDYFNFYLRKWFCRRNKLESSKIQHIPNSSTSQSFL